MSIQIGIWDLLLALAAGWLVYLCLYVPLTWSIWFRPEGRVRLLLHQP